MAGIAFVASIFVFLLGVVLVSQAQTSCSEAVLVALREATLSKLVVQEEEEALARSPSATPAAPAAEPPAPRAEAAARSTEEAPRAQAAPSQRPSWIYVPAKLSEAGCRIAMQPTDLRPSSSSVAVKKQFDADAWQGVHASAHATHFAKHWPLWPCLWGNIPLGDFSGEEGPKFVCGFERYLWPSCVVYSFGSRALTTFEDAVFRANPSCEVHIFDPTVDPVGSKFLLHSKRWHFHAFGLAGTAGNLPRVGKVDILSAIAARLGHQRIDILKVDIEGAEFDAVQQWAQDPQLPAIVQVQMEVHYMDKPGHGLGTVIEPLQKLGLRLFHVETNGADCTEISMVQRSFVPGRASYSMGRSREDEACEVEFPAAVASSRDSFMAQLRAADAETTRRLQGGSLPKFALEISRNYACRWTEEFAGGRPVCGVRELGRSGAPCRALAMSSFFEGPEFRRGLQAIAPSCDVTVVQVRRPPLHRPDGRCGAAALSPDGSGPAHCASGMPCCHHTGNWCGSQESHCGHGTNFDTVRKSGSPLASPLPPDDGPVLWVADPPTKLPRRATEKGLDLLQASGSSVKVALDWVKALGPTRRLGQLILDFRIDEEVAVRAAVDLLHGLGYVPTRMAVLPADDFLGSDRRLELHLLSTTWSPDQS